MGAFRYAAVVVPLAMLLAACHKPPPRLPAAPVTIPRTPLPAETLPAPLLPAIDSVDDYKRVLAAQIMKTNPDAVFSGAIPPLLTAIVVLEMKVDGDGAIRSLRVARARDQKAAGIAEAIMRQAAPYPRPGKLMRQHHKTFDFSETFLFNKDYRFQLRTLAPVQ